MRKEKIIYTSLAVIIAVMLFLDGSFSLSDKRTAQVFNLGDFKLTRIDLQCEVYITQGNNEKLVVEGPDDLLNKLSIDQNNGILSISGNAGEKSFFGLINNPLKFNERVKIYINHSQLDRIIVNNEATIISVDYKPVRYQAKNYAHTDAKPAYFRFVKLLHLDLEDFLPKITPARIYSYFR